MPHFFFFWCVCVALLQTESFPSHGSFAGTRFSPDVRKAVTTAEEKRLFELTAYRFFRSIHSYFPGWG